MMKTVIAQCLSATHARFMLIVRKLAVPTIAGYLQLRGWIPAMTGK
jgi:hypothetical protein